MPRRVWQDWSWMVEGFRELGFSSAVRELPIDQTHLVIDLGDGWLAQVSTASGNLRDYSPSEDPIQVTIFGDEVGAPSGGYTLDWFPPTENVRHLPRAVAPLLRRVAAHREPARSMN